MGFDKGRYVVIWSDDEMDNYNVVTDEEIISKTVNACATNQWEVNFISRAFDCGVYTRLYSAGDWIFDFDKPLLNLVTSLLQFFTENHSLGLYLLKTPSRWGKWGDIFFIRRYDPRDDD